MHNLILCGGSGTRLWPLSRTKLSKQFVRLFEGKSLFQHTVSRNKNTCDSSVIIANQEQYFLLLDQLFDFNLANSKFLLEPVGRNTAPAISLACLGLEADDILLVTPSDHIITNQTAYDEAVNAAKKLAEQGFLVTFGIKPKHADTGFGYIECKGDQVLSFTEKPNIETAESYIKQDNYLWNAGMFCFKAGVFLEEMQQHSADILQACKLALANCQTNDQEYRINMADMQAIPSDSIDYALFEKSNKVRVVACDMGWSDIGNFDALYEHLDKNQQNNAIVYNAISAQPEKTPEPICQNSNNNLILCNKRQITTLNVDDLIVVDTDDALLIAKKGSAQEVKDLVAMVKKTNPELTDIHQMVYRPWGFYEVLITSRYYKVKRICVSAGKKLSLQKHYHRNEHWIVVSGTATVTIDNKTSLLCQNESTYIKIGQVHRLANDGLVDLIIIEAQLGEYTGEDDIVRLDDNYGRS